MKSHIPYICASAALLLAIAAGACSDELGTPSQTSTRDIQFTASLANSSSRTRSMATREMSRVEVLPMSLQTSEDSMYLHSEILDWDFSPSSSSKMTRSNMVHSGSGMYGSFNVSAYQYTDDWTSSKASYQPNYFYSESASGSQSAGYNMDTRRYWPSSGKMRFIAFAPASAAYQMANVDNTAGPYVHIEVDADASKHQDLVVAYSQEVDCSSTHPAVNLNFKHALACIQFVMADDMQQSRIKSISIKGVKYWGDMRYRDNMTNATDASTADANLNDSYYPWDGTRDITLNLADSDNPNGKEVNPSDTITDETHSFMMFPQIVPDGATIEITLSRRQTDGSWGSDEVMFGYIDGKRWPAGKIIRYRVSNERWWQELQVSSLPAFAPEGGENYFSITSFDLGENGEKQPVKWTVQYEDPANPGTFTDTKPAWYDFDTANEGSIDPQSIKVTVQPNAVSRQINLNNELKSVGSQGSQVNPYNLSTGRLGKTAVGTTANCYIVDRPGWYAIPLVYGNAIKGGSQNTTAYQPNADTSNGALKNFVNYLGSDISSPYILTDCAGVAYSVATGSAKVVWQDHPGLIQNANITVDKTAFGGHGGIIFQITESDITQGNCVIGLEIPGQSGKMLWSWHIWVTPFFRPGLDDTIKETIGVTNHDGSTMNLLNLNLGWVSEFDVDIYAERTSTVRFTATTSDKRTLTKDLTVIQMPFVKYWHGSNTYYQWGRKDPFMPFLVSWSNTWYDSTGAVRTGYPSGEKFGNGTSGMSGRIQNPSVFHCSDDTPIDNDGNAKPINLQLFTNLWDATYSARPTVNVYNPNAIDPVTVPARDNVKTVYDPCPPGYKVPPVTAFTGFTNTGNDIGELVDNPKNWNGILTEYLYNCGAGITQPSVFLFYTDTGKTSYIAFPLTGYRDWRLNSDGTSASAYRMGNYGYSWTAGAASDIEGYYLELRKDQGASGSGWILPLDYFWQLDGMPIRPCRE